MNFIDIRRQSLQKIGDLESLLLPKKFPHSIPDEFNSLPRLLGRASVKMKTTKGDMYAVIDGYNAPLTGGAFIDNVYVVNSVGITTQTISGVTTSISKVTVNTNLYP